MATPRESILELMEDARIARIKAEIREDPFGGIPWSGGPGVPDQITCGGDGPGHGLPGQCPRCGASIHLKGKCDV